MKLKPGEIVYHGKEVFIDEISDEKAYKIGLVKKPKIIKVEDKEVK